MSFIEKYLVWSGLFGFYAGGLGGAYYAIKFNREHPDISAETKTFHLVVCPIF